MPKEKIHPNYAAVRVMCACGNNFETRSTHKGDIHVEICSVCHPFFTGKQRLVDTAGRVERFRRKYAKADSARSSSGQVTDPGNRLARMGLRYGGGLVCVGANRNFVGKPGVLIVRLGSPMRHAKRSIQSASHHRRLLADLASAPRAAAGPPPRGGLGMAIHVSVCRRRAPGASLGVSSG